MIPRVQTGSSFKGAALYYLHDKRRDGEAERLTTERVAWTLALNTLEDDPTHVIAEMQHTAMNQNILKRQAGMRLDGRPTEQTVMTVALAWSPTQQPSRDDMIEAAKSYLNHMGWSEHQTLLVAHNDTKHPHLHLIINRVHPETGMTQDANWSKTRSQRWALAYEREQGQVLCQAREGRYEARDTMNRREWETWQVIAKEGRFDQEFAQALQGGEWAALKSSQKAERIDYWKETGKQRSAIRREIADAVRKEFAPEWKAYAKEKEERAEKARLYDLEARRAKRELRRGGLKPARVIEENATGKKVSRRVWDREGVKKIEERQAAYHVRLKQDLAGMRADIYARQKQRMEELAAPSLSRHSKERNESYRSLLKEQMSGRAQLRGDQSEGKRRYDVLQPTRIARFTDPQMKGYVRQAQESVAKEAEFRKAAPQAVPSRGEPEHKPSREISDAAREKRDKDQKVEARSKSMREWYLAKRKSDRDRERDGSGGGRER